MGVARIPERLCAFNPDHGSATTVATQDGREYPACANCGCSDPETGDVDQADSVRHAPLSVLRAKDFVPNAVRLCQARCAKKVQELVLASLAESEGWACDWACDWDPEWERPAHWGAAQEAGPRGPRRRS